MVKSEWNAIKARIDGFAATAHLVLSGHISNSSDTGMLSQMIEEGKAINRLLIDWVATNHKQLPPECVRAIHIHTESDVKPPYTGGNAPLSIAATVAPFISLASVVTYLLTDNQQSIRSLTERAFSHIQRSIAVSTGTRKEWQTAFENGETFCEGLGASHLLQFGIFAFKVNATGARTDLVFPEPIDYLEVSRSAEGLVLTEWKKVNFEEETETKAKEAVEQTTLYTDSVLAGIELRTCRFIVLLSSTQLSQVPQDFQIGDVSYRHVNIAVNPESPSKVARKRSK